MISELDLKSNENSVRHIFSLWFYSSQLESLIQVCQRELLDLHEKSRSSHFLNTFEKRVQDNRNIILHIEKEEKQRKKEKRSLTVILSENNSKISKIGYVDEIAINVNRSSWFISKRLLIRIIIDFRFSNQQKLILRSTARVEYVYKTSLKIGHEAMRKSPSFYRYETILIRNTWSLLPRHQWLICIRGNLSENKSVPRQPTARVYRDNEAIKKYLEGENFWIAVCIKHWFCVYFNSRMIDKRRFSVFTSWQLGKDGPTKVSRRS